MALVIKSLMKDIHANALSKGFWGRGRKNVAEKLMLVVSELSEAMEADRNNKHGLEKKDTFEDELADALIRILDICAYYSIDIEKQVVWKMLYNKSRPFLHGKKY